MTETHTIPEGRLHYWGKPDEQREVIPGVIWVTTPSHGGLVLSNERQAQMPEYLREPSAVYEEDCDWPLPIYGLDIAREFAAIFPHQTPERIMDEARQTLRHWHAEAYTRALSNEQQQRNYYLPQYER